MSKIDELKTSSMGRIDALVNELCPDGVDRVKLGDCCDILNGFAFQSKNYESTGIRVIRISDVQDGYLSNDDIKHYPLSYGDEIKRYILHEHDLVMSLTGNVGRVAFIPQSAIPAALNQRVACFREKNCLSINYLYHILCNPQFQAIAMDNANGAGQKNLSTTWLSNYEIPLPPLSIQQEIVSVLDSFTTLIDKMKLEVEKRKKQMEYYREELLTFEEGECEWKKVGEIGEVRMCKRILKNQTSSTGDIPFYKIGTFGKTADAFISKELYEEYKMKYNYPQSGEVLISAAGTIGRCVVFDGTPSYFQDSNIVWIENNEKCVSNKYLKWFYCIAKWNIQNGGSVARLYNDNLKSTEIPVPSLAKQSEIVSTLDKFESYITKLEKMIELRQKQYEYYREKLLTF